MAEPTNIHFDATESLLRTITTKSESHEDPQQHIHTPSNQPQSQSWFRAVFPYDSLEDFENQWHLGNYIIDRQTSKKSFEPMSFYVRVGMHLLYYGSQQENLLH